MKKIDLGQTVGILANLGVIGGIVFLGFELRQNQLIGRAQTQTAIADARREMTQVDLQGTMAETFVRRQRGESLTPARPASAVAGNGPLFCKAERPESDGDLNRWMQHAVSDLQREVLQMAYRKRIYYTEADRALMWDRWQQGDSMHTIARLFDRAHSSVQGMFAEAGVTGREWQRLVVIHGITRQVLGGLHRSGWKVRHRVVGPRLHGGQVTFQGITRYLPGTT